MAFGGPTRQEEYFSVKPHGWVPLLPHSFLISDHFRSPARGHHRPGGRAVPKRAQPDI